MEIFQFDRGERIVQSYGSQGLSATRVAAGTGQVRLTCLTVAPGGLIGTHPATDAQLFLVIAGQGWAAGADGERVPISAGWGVRWDAGETHTSGTEAASSRSPLKVARSICSSQSSGLTCGRTTALDAGRNNIERANRRMELQMQPLAIYALITGAVMILGVAVTLILTRHAAEPRRAAVNRWNMHGSFPLAAAGVVIGVISRSGGQSPATHDVVYAVAATLLLAALLCALVGAARASMASSRLRG